MKKCPRCGGKVEDKTVNHTQTYKDGIVIVENVPAEVCRQCGEVFLRPEVLERVQQVVWSEGEPDRTAQIPVYDLAEPT